VYCALLVGGAGVAGRLVPAPLAVWTVLGGRSLRREALGLASQLEANDLAGARAHASALVGRDPRELDSAELARAAVESVAENTSDAIVASAFWFALGGAPAAAAHRAANTLDAMVGYRSERYRDFGWAAARVDDAVNWLPARLTALLAVAAAPAVGGSVPAALRVLHRDGGAHPSPNAGRVEAAFAGALDVRLGGANRYGGRLEQRPYLGGGRPPGLEDVARAVRLSRIVEWAALALCAVVAARRW
jgi:adenosylcobinamide-phosphate synthase